MRILAVLMFLSMRVQADGFEDPIHDHVMGPEPTYQLAQPLETPEYKPVQTGSYLNQSDTDWTASMRQLDVERQPRQR